MAESVNKSELTRRRFLRNTAVLGGLTIGGSMALSACGDAAAPAAPTTAAPTTAAPTTAAPTTAAPTTAAPTTAASNATTAAGGAAAAGDFIDAGPLADFAEATTNPKLVPVPGAKAPSPTNIFVFKKGESFNALSNICTHRQCEVAWAPADKEFQCPCHGSKYDATGKNIAGPAPAPLNSFTTKVENGRLLVSVKKA